MADLSLDGLTSGFPTKDMVDQLMQIERLPIYRYETDKVDLNEQKDAWRDINSRIDKLEDKLTALKLNATYNSNKSTSTNKDVVTASATSTAVEGNYQIEVINTAKAQRLSGTRLDSSTTAFSELFATFPVLSNIMINGSSVEVSEEDTLSTLVSKINDSVEGVNASIVDNHLVLESSETGLENQLGLIDDNGVLETLGVLSANDNSRLQTASLDVLDANTALGYEGQFSVTIENTGETAIIDVNADSSLNNIADAINNQLANNQASVVDNGDGTFSLLLDDATNPIKMQSTSADGKDNILEKLRFGNQAINNQLQGASNAEIEVNGITGISSSDNNFSDVVDGVTFNIDESAQNGDLATVSISKDTGKTTLAVKSFVDQYNSLMNFIDGKLDYDPETKKAGTLQGDSTLIRLGSRIRSLITDRVSTEGNYNHLGAVGISIDRDGVMSFDSSKLNTALDEAPEDVMNLFRANKDDDGFDGVANSLDRYLDQLIQSNTGVIPRRLDYYDKQVDRIDDDIESLERRLETTRERYISQFTAMEKAISNMQQQQSWMMSQLAGMGGNSNTMGSMM